MKNFLSLENLELKSPLSIKSFISASSEINDCPITNILQEDKNIWLSEEFLPQEIILNFQNIKLKEYPKKLTAIGIYCWNKYPTNPKIIEVLISKELGNNYISLGHFDLSFKAGRQLIYLDDDNDAELEELLNTVDFENLIIKLIIKETFGGKHTYINNLYLYDNIDTNNINPNINMNNNNMNVNNNNLNNQYIFADENNDINNINNINNINDIQSDRISSMNLKINDNNLPNNENEINNINDTPDINETNDINENANQDLINNNNNNSNEEKNIEEKNSPNIEEDNDNDNISDYKSKTMIENNFKRRISNKMRGNKTPKIFKKYNQEERPMTANSLNNRIINTTIRQYNNKNILDYSNNNNNNNSINNITNSNYNNLNINSSSKLSQLINEFKNYKENQDAIMNNYETRVRLLEEKCMELKNTMKKMNATMNTIIDNQYSQNQASNDYYLKECHNMINEAIVNAISNMGRNMGGYSMHNNMPIPTLYTNYPLNMRNMNNLDNNMFFNNFNRSNNNSFMNRTNFGQKDMNFNNMNNINTMNNYYNDNNEENYMNENYNNNDNDVNNMNNINVNDINNENENDNVEEILAQEIQNMGEMEQYNNNLTNENNMEYYENDGINNHTDEKSDNNINNNLNEHNNIESNLIDNNINNINSQNQNSNDEKTVKSLHSNELYNDGLIPYDERIKSNPKKYSNIFAKSTNNYKINNNLDNNQARFNTFYDSRIAKKKNRAKKNSNPNMDNIINQNLTEIKKENKKYLSMHNSKQNIKIQDLNLNNNINNNNINYDMNKDLSSSSDNSIDNIKINTNLTENILKPTLEKFENYMSINNINNFGKSQNVYSANSFSTKKGILGENDNKEKISKDKLQNKNDKNNINSNKKKRISSKYDENKIK